MGHRTTLVPLALAASVVGVLTGVGFGRASGVEACGATRGSSLGAAIAISHGLGLPAVVGSDALVDVAADHQRFAEVAPSVGSGIVRHVAAGSRFGTAYVVDRRGADRVVIVTPARTITLEQPGEATHPSWSADGRLVWSLGSRLRVWSPDMPTFDIAAPAGTLGLFSPVFAAPDAIVAVVAEPEPGSLGAEGEGIDNLWRYDLADRHWDRLTRFHAHGDRWVAIRTPVLRSDGSLEFVRMRGISTRTGLPSFALWRSTLDGAASQIRRLPQEMYLAGILAGKRVWNIYDQASGEWRLYSERTRSTFEDLGCGAVMVDPRSVDDPDRTPPDREPSPTPTSTPTSTPTPTPTPTPTRHPPRRPRPPDAHARHPIRTTGTSPASWWATSRTSRPPPRPRQPSGMRSVRRRRSRSSTARPRRTSSDRVCGRRSCWSHPERTRS